jgi:hypothetical protein
MYTIIGGDGKEYGPVTAEQVRSWIAGGRANLETKVKEVGGDTWKTVADFPEIISPSSAPAAAMARRGSSTRLRSSTSSAATSAAGACSRPTSGSSSA